MAAHPEQHATGHHRRGGERGHQLPRGEDRGDEALRGGLRRAVPVDGGLDTQRRAFLRTVGTYHLGADDGLRDRAQHVRDPFPDDEVAAGDTRLEPPDDDGHGDEAGVDEDGQGPGVDGHQRGHDQHLPAGQQQDHAAELQELRHLVDVAGDPGGECAPPLLRLGQHGQVVDVSERAYPQRRQRRFGRPVEPDVHAVGRQRRHHDRHGRARHRGPDHGEVRRPPAGKTTVDGLLDRDRDHGPSSGGDDRE